MPPFSHRAVIFPDNHVALAMCRSLGPLGVPVDVLAVGPASPGQYSRYARGLRCPDPGQAEDAFIGFLSDLAQQHEAQPVLFCADDRTILLFEKHRAVLEPLFRLSFPPWECVKTLLLKDALYLHGLDGIPSPVTLPLQAETDLDRVGSLMDFPLLLKPTLRCLRIGEEINSPPFEKVFGEKAVRIRDTEELAQQFHKATSHGFPTLVQEEIPGGVEQLLTLAIYASQEGQIKAAWTARKLAQVPADFGDALIVEAIWKPELLALGERLVKASGLYGIADIEFKLDPRDGQYKLLDINPRPWPWIHFPTACGVNIPYIAYCDLLGIDTPPAIAGPKMKRKRWISPRGVVSYLVKQGRKGALTLKDLIRLAGVARTCQMGSLVCVTDPLWRLFVQPAYWQEALRLLPGSREGSLGKEASQPR